MKYTLTYARVGNAKPLYCLTDEYGAQVLCRTIEDVWGEVSIGLPCLRDLGKRARNGEAVEFQA